MPEINSNGRILIPKANLGVSAQVRFSVFEQLCLCKDDALDSKKSGCTVDGSRTAEAWAARPDISTL